MRSLSLYLLLLRRARPALVLSVHPRLLMACLPLVASELCTAGLSFASCCSALSSCSFALRLSLFVSALSVSLSPPTCSTIVPPELSRNHLGMLSLGSVSFSVSWRLYTDPQSEERECRNRRRHKRRRVKRGPATSVGNLACLGALSPALG